MGLENIRDKVFEIIYTLEFNFKKKILESLMDNLIDWVTKNNSVSVEKQKNYIHEIRKEIFMI